MNIKKSLSTLITILFCSGISGKELPKNYFRSPVDFPITLSGNFGELRNNHFHSGIDIRTFGNGKKVYAVADGFVSRIKISANGYGKALYIDHPNGYTSVYAHLNSFSKEINDFIESQQYKNKSFEIDMEIPHEQFQLHKGAVIAYSGNTGSSAGPHLHFEIRETSTEFPVNPLLFNLKIPDTTAPKIFNLYVYPLDENSSVNGQNHRSKFPVTYYNGTYRLKEAAQIRLHGRIGFALETNDYLNGTWNKCGIFSLQFNLDGNEISYFEIPNFSFDETRYINSHMDYELCTQHKKRIHKTFKEPNNQLSIYKSISNNGIAQFLDDQSHTIEFIVKDVSNNTARLKLSAKSNPNGLNQSKHNFTKLMPFNQENRFENDDLEVIFPENSLYDTLFFNYQKEINPGQFYSDIHQIHQNTTPVHLHYTLGIRPENLPEQLRNKALIASIDEKGKLQSEGGIFFNGWVKTKTRNLGKFAVVVDTIPPTIKPLEKYKDSNLKGYKKIRFHIQDDLAGIKSYRGEIDGQWVLFEYDAKSDLLFYRFDPKRLKSNQKHNLSIVVTDHMDNESRYSNHFYW